VIKKLIKLVVTTLLLLVSACGVTDSSGQTGATPTSLEVDDVRQRLVVIDGIARLKSDGSSNWPYFENSSVRYLYMHPYIHQRATQELWRDQAVPMRIKSLSARLLQCLPITEYLALIRSSFASYKVGEVDAAVVEILISPGSDWGTLLDLSYQDPATSSVLKDIASDPAATEGIRERIADILSGESAAYIKAYNLPSEPLPSMRCFPL